MASSRTSSRGRCLSPSGRAAFRCLPKQHPSWAGPREVKFTPTFHGNRQVTLVERWCFGGTECGIIKQSEECDQVPTVVALCPYGIEQANSLCPDHEHRAPGSTPVTSSRHILSLLWG